MRYVIRIDAAWMLNVALQDLFELSNFGDFYSVRILNESTKLDIIIYIHLSRFIYNNMLPLIRSIRFKLDKYNVELFYHVCEDRCDHCVGLCRYCVYTCFVYILDVYIVFV